MNRTGTVWISLKLARILFAANGAIWTVFGLASLQQLAAQAPEDRPLFGLFAGLMFGNAAAMLLAGRLLRKGQRRSLYFALVVLSVNIILTITDQFGLRDLFTLAIDLALLGIVVARWRALGARSRAGSPAA